MSSHNNNQNAPDINTSYPGHIYNFDAESQTCEVQLAIESLFIGHEESYSRYTKQRLQHVPVQFTQGGGWSFTHPIPDGTPCNVQFAQRGIDHWLFENKDEAGTIDGKPAPAFSQLYSHNAATCTVGTQPIPKAIPNFVGDVMEMRNEARSQRVTFHGNGRIELVAGSAKITINSSGEISIESPSKITATAPQIILDGATTITKTLSVQGGGAGGGAAVTMVGNIEHTGSTNQTGSLTINGVKVDGHNHISNSPGQDTGPMK
ncbi:baseplate central spike [Pectobacterium phage PP101]|uniref:Baseplate central spike n=1 Tax=Pectobacterium phage PP101 TaxID=1916414 RepID=A0A1J0MF38_9CAUD|nr:baseplate spike [Pectobacterium phage PP101]APD19726.1 baseplate central spike [Pectobacterium phage PP101]